MRRSSFFVLASVSLAAGSTALAGGEFVESITDYSEGTFATVSGQHFTDTTAAVGQPQGVVGTGPFAGALTPFDGHYEQSQLTAIGVGGHMTLQFHDPVPVNGKLQVGIFTSAALTDMDYPNGAVGDNPHTNAFDEYGADRSAIVEVASDPSNFKSLGRVLFDDPTNYYQNAATPFDLPNASYVPADFGKSYTGSPSDLKVPVGDPEPTFSDVVASFHGSAGGTWLDIPASLGLTSVQYIRLSDPLWEVSPTDFETELKSGYYPPPDEFTKPADLFLNGAILTPEPATVGLCCLASLALIRKRR